MSKKIIHRKEEIADLVDLAESAIGTLLNDLELKVEEELQRPNAKKESADNVKLTESIEDQLRKSRERIERLKDLSMKLRTGNIQELENIPAYKNRDVSFDQVSTKENSQNQNNIDLLSKFKKLTDFNVIDFARRGLPKSALLSFAKKISLNIQELANILHISERTLQRYEDDVIIKTEYAEKAIELARLYTRGEEVFESMDKFKIWIKTPSVVFRGEAPVTILDTSAGFDMVFKELGRIEHGIFA